eukprot:GILI01005560.1.p1 GENE.GILI01005560.1~~GILI01005560.1.p1  ORF type:complete len:437 (+),score=159.75 GILI01005560.1:37-1311(+)
MTTLYINQGCPYAQRAAITAAYKKFTGPIIEVGLRDDMPEWYKKEINPRELVPALKLADGTCLSESFFVAQYLDESIEPKNELFPSNPETRRKILAITDAAEGLTGVAFGSIMASEADQEKANAALRASLADFVTKLSKDSPFAYGVRFSFADVVIIPFILRFHYVMPALCNFELAKEFPRLAAFIDACLAIPAVASTTLPAAAFIETFGKYAGGKVPKHNYHVSKKADAASERLQLAVAYITANSKPAVKSFFTEADTKEEPSLRLPNGESLRATANTVEYLAETFPEAGLLPSYTEDTSAAKRLAGRYFVDSINRVFDEFSQPIEKRTKGFEISEDVAYELRNAERVYTNAGPAGKTYLFGDKPSAYDLIVLPYVHRSEILLGGALAAIAPNIVKAVQAARKDAVLGSVFESADRYLAGASA